MSHSERSRTAAVLTSKPREEPHMSGKAHCIQCDHVWGAVAPVGTVFLECPECKTQKGRFVGHCAPDDGVEFRECNCGNQLFYLTREGHMCANCGTYQFYEDD